MGSSPWSFPTPTGQASLHCYSCVKRNCSFCLKPLINFHVKFKSSVCGPSYPCLDSSPSLLCVYTCIEVDLSHVGTDKCKGQKVVKYLPQSPSTLGLRSGLSLACNSLIVLSWWDWMYRHTELLTRVLEIRTQVLRLAQQALHEVHANWAIFLVFPYLLIILTYGTSFSCHLVRKYFLLSLSYKYCLYFLNSVILLLYAILHVI